MTTVPRSRFSKRLGLTEDGDDAPYEGVPRHLAQPLRRWLKAASAAMTMRQKGSACACASRCFGDNPTHVLILQDGTGLLDVVDAVLGHEDEAIGGDLNAELTRILHEAGSAYRVNDAGDCLEERVEPTVREAVRTAITDADAQTSAGSAGDHLSMTWQAAYGIGPDPVRAYSEAIKAVECAAHAVVQPNHARRRWAPCCAPSRSRTPSLFPEPKRSAWWR